MHLASEPQLAPPPNARRKSGSCLTLPEWVSNLTRLSDPIPVPIGAGLTAGIATNSEFALATIRVEWAARLDSMEFRERTTQAYTWVFSALGDCSPVRFWNFLPDIHRLQPGGQSRYMVFNSGRYLAFERQYGNAESFDQQIATASAVGHAGQHLYIHCLAARGSGIHLGNPRQVSPHKYSSRYGKRPPCFARATWLAEQNLLLIGGTASIRGEESLHNDLESQLNETLLNLSKLIHSAARQLNCDCGIDAFSGMSDVRVYHTRSVDDRALEKLLANRFANSADIELVQATLCREELLVEIEGIARMPSCVDNSQGPCEP